MEGKEEASKESVTFLQIPKMLFTEERFRSVSNSGKLLYGILLDRNSLSVSNGWKDERERVYVYCTVENVAELLSCSNKKAMKVLAELEEEGLIERIRQGQGKPSKILVKNLAIGGKKIGSDRNYNSD